MLAFAKPGADFSAGMRVQGIACLLAKPCPYYLSIFLLLLLSSQRVSSSTSHLFSPFRTEFFRHGPCRLFATTPPKSAGQFAHLFGLSVVLMCHARMLAGSTPDQLRGRG
jgi:hypothetical protein